MEPRRGKEKKRKDRDLLYSLLASDPGRLIPTTTTLVRISVPFSFLRTSQFLSLPVFLYLPISSASSISPYTVLFSFSPPLLYGEH